MRIKVNHNTMINRALSRVLKKKIDFNLNGITIDSRNIKKGDLFIALKGEKQHGAEFINEDIINKVSHIISDMKIDSDKFTFVEDSTEFLRNFSHCFRDKIKTKIIGITGTNGKTSTKELLADFLKTKYNISYSKGNYNTTISLPLSLLECDIDSDYCILEMGASKTGEIEILSDICNPDFGLITNISEAHIEGYKNFNDLINTKLALYESINRTNGTFFLNKDDSNIYNRCNIYSDKIISYSMYDIDSNFTGNLSETDKGMVSINNNSFNVPYNTTAFAYNFLASYSIAVTLGVELKAIQEILNQFKLPEGRGNYLKINTNIIINDFYNANLESMISGISQLKYMNIKKGKTIIVLGDMLELGERSKRNHEKLGQYINKLDFIDLVCGYGELIEGTLDIINNSKIRKKYFNKKNVLTEYLKRNISKNDIIYFKGSRNISLEVVIKRIFPI